MGPSLRHDHGAERLSSLFVAMHKNGMEAKRLRMISKTAESAPSLALIEGRKGGKPGLVVLPPLVLQDEKGNASPEMRMIYHRR